jgi:hypothetical protein
MGDEYVDLITKNLSPSAANEIRKLWAEKRLQVYLPLYREGDYWVRYEAVLPDGKTETVYRAFMSPEAREQGIEDAEREGIVGEAQRFSRIDQAFGGESVGPFFNKVMEELKDKKVPPAVMNSLYELYLDQIPASSVRQMHRTREGYKGYESDLINVYSTVGSRMMNQLNNLEFIPDLDAAYTEVEEQAAVSAASSKNLAVNKLMANLKLQREYWNDPTHNMLVTTATSFSYYWYIIANVSTAVINLSQIPMVVYPMLTGRFGTKAGDALTKAKDIYFQGGWDKVTDNDSEIADWSFGVNLPPNSPLKKLYDLAVNQSAIRRSSGTD